MSDFQKNKQTKKKETTSWQNVASWYDELLESGEGTFQKELILPNTLHMLAIKKGEKLLDLGCGQGFFSREFFKAGANVVGIDIAPKLIAIGKERSSKEIDFRVASAEKLGFIKNSSIDIVVSILAIQNMKNITEVMSEVSRVLRPGGRLLLVINHPAFRIPKRSSWIFDEKLNIQYRRIDEYLSPSSSPIEMHPGLVEKNSVTFSFHHPLQFYFKIFHKIGFLTSQLEEWHSNKQSQPGPRAKAENKARKEFPLFLALEARKL